MEPVTQFFAVIDAGDVKTYDFGLTQIPPTASQCRLEVECDPPGPIVNLQTGSGLTLINFEPPGLQFQQATVPINSEQIPAQVAFSVTNPLGTTSDITLRVLSFQDDI